MALLVLLTSHTRHFILPSIGRKLDGKFEVNPFGGTNFEGTASAFVRVLLHLLAGEGVWGRGRHLSPRPQQPLRNLFLVLFVHKSLNRCASIVGLAFGLALKFFRRSITKCGMQALPIVILVDEFFDVGS